MNCSDERVFQFRMDLDKAVKYLKEQRLGGEVLLVLSEKLQSELACDSREKYRKYSQSLELIMRSVIAVLSIDEMSRYPDWPAYPVNNLRIGVVGLLRSFGLKVQEVFKGYT